MGTNTSPGPGTARDKLLDAALYEIRAHGYSGTTVDDLCRAAGVTKGAFFHHFRSKEDLAVAAAGHFADGAAALFENAPYRDLDDPLDRLIGYVRFRQAILVGEMPEWTCLAGTMAQEAYASHPAIRAACDRTISGHAATLEADIEAAMERRGVSGDWTAAGLALHIQAVIQGAFVVAKARNDVQVATDSLDHLARYLELLFTRAKKGKAHG